MRQPTVELALSLDPGLVEQMRHAVVGGRARRASELVEHTVRAWFAAEIEYDVDAGGDAGRLRRADHR